MFNHTVNVINTHCWTLFEIVRQVFLKLIICPAAPSRSEPLVPLRKSASLPWRRWARLMSASTPVWTRLCGRRESGNAHCTQSLDSSTASLQRWIESLSRCIFLLLSPGTSRTACVCVCPGSATKMKIHPTSCTHSSRTFPSPRTKVRTEIWLVSYTMNPVGDGAHTHTHTYSWNFKVLCGWLSAL